MFRYTRHNDFQVLSKRTNAQGEYVGRPTKWGNPFTLNHKTATTEDFERVVTQYAEYLRNNQMLLNDLHELKGKNLVCWCAPKPCHAEVLMYYANALY